jgi:hypothetical protein
MIHFGATSRSFFSTSFLLSFLLVVNVCTTLACKCMELSVEDAYKMADFIVLGKVTDVKYGEEQNVISLNAITCFKGDCHGSEKFSTSSSSASCGFYSFTKEALDFDDNPVGGTFIVYSTIDPNSKEKLVNSCGGTKRIVSDAVPYVLEVDSLYKLSWGDEVSGSGGSGD